MSVSGRMIWRTPIIDGNQRYSWTKNRRSLLVSRALPRHVRPSRISCWRRTAFSASSRAVDLNGETKRAKANHRSPITRSAYAIRPPPQWNEVLGTHSGKTVFSPGFPSREQPSLRLKPRPRSERRGQDGQYETREGRSPGQFTRFALGLKGMRISAQTGPGLLNVGQNCL